MTQRIFRAVPVPIPVKRGESAAYAWRTTEAETSCQDVFFQKKRRRRITARLDSLFRNTDRQHAVGVLELLSY
jgi:hypothetical protein